MVEILNILRPFIGGLVGVLFVYLFVKYTKSSAIESNGRKILNYSLPFKLFTVVLIPFSIFVVYAASQARESQIVVATIVALFFILGALFSGYHVFFVKLSYDNNYIYYQTPFNKKQQASWSALVEIGYSSLLDSNYFVIDGMGKVWCPNVLNGHDELGTFLEKKAKELFPEENNS